MDAVSCSCKHSSMQRRAAHINKPIFVGRSFCVSLCICKVTLCFHPLRVFALPFRSFYNKGQHCVYCCSTTDFRVQKKGKGAACLRLVSSQEALDGKGTSC